MRRESFSGWFVSLFIAFLFFGAHPELITYSQMKGVLLSLNVLYIIWAALFLYHIVNETGAIKAIGIGIERFSADKSIQILIFGWIFSSFLQGVAGYGVPTSLGIVSMVGFAMIMDHCQMIYILAEGISNVFGSFYPLISPWIGLLGAFMTGSNTNSNVVFTALQQGTAQLSGLSVALILAAQTTGGALGSMIAPAKILVGCSTVGLSGKEWPVLKATLKYGFIITGIIGIITILASIFFTG